MDRINARSNRSARSAYPVATHVNGKADNPALANNGDSAPAGEKPVLWQPTPNASPRAGTLLPAGGYAVTLSVTLTDNPNFPIGSRIAFRAAIGSGPAQSRFIAVAIDDDYRQPLLDTLDHLGESGTLDTLIGEIEFALRAKHKGGWHYGHAGSFRWRIETLTRLA